MKDILDKLKVLEEMTIYAQTTAEESLVPLVDQMGSNHPNTNEQ